MDRVERLRRVALLCCHFVRNCAYYKAGWNGSKTRATNEFWRTIQGNFIDIAVLEWLKLFGGHKDKHYWEKIAEDPVSFKEGMLKNLKIKEDELSSCRTSFKEYRDKFVAHLDSDDIMQIPVLDFAIVVVKYYYSYVAKELGSSGLRNLPKELESYYQKCFSDSEKFFGK